jgi:hypothetical protein
MTRFVVVNKINPAAVAAADAALSEKTNGAQSTQPRFGDDLRDFWLDVYESNGGKVVTIAPKGRAAAPIKEKCPPPSTIPEAVDFDDDSDEDSDEEEPPPLELRIVEMSFLSDHGLLRDNETDWDNTGDLFEKPDWTPKKSNTISHSINKRLSVRVVIRAEGTGVETGKIKARVTLFRPPVAGRSIFDAQAITLTAGRASAVTFTSRDDFASELGDRGCQIEWFVKTDRRRNSCIGATKNRVLFTFASPVSRPIEPDDGVTVKRMVKAVRAIEAIRKLRGNQDPHEIVGACMGSFGHYTLTRDLDVPEKYGHPRYTDPKAGAWPMADYSSHSGECQAICRFVRGLLDQIGCPGTLEPVMVWCDPDTMEAKEGPYDKSGIGLRFCTKKVSTDVEVQDPVPVVEEPRFFDRLLGKTPVTRIEVRSRTERKEEIWLARLTTSEATVGEDAEGSGLNLYEACLKFTHNGVTKYYGGGAGTFDSAEDVVRGFHSLIWICREENPADRQGPLVSICRKIVHTF